MRLFAVGLPKTGTSTLQKALAESGWRSAHWLENGILIGRSVYQRYLEGVDPLLDFAGYDAITQADLITQTESYWPQMDPMLLRTISRYHPQCCFVMSTRDPSKTVASISSWVDLRARLIKLGAPGLPAGFASDDAKLRRWIEDHYAFTRRHFANDGRFFEFDIDDENAPAIIEAKLGIKLAWWGVANQGPGLRRSPGIA